MAVQGGREVCLVYPEVALRDPLFSGKTGQRAGQHLGERGPVLPTSRTWAVSLPTPAELLSLSHPAVFRSK